MSRIADRRFFLRATLKLMALMALGALVYVFAAAAFDNRTPGSAGGRLRVDLSTLAPGQWRTVEWGARQIIILHRSAPMLRDIDRLSAASASALANERLKDADSRWSTQPQAARNPYRSIRPEFFVAFNYDTGLSCPLDVRGLDSTSNAPAWRGGFVAQCRDTRYDFAGRVFAQQGAAKNLTVPAYRFLNNDQIEFGGS